MDPSVVVIIFSLLFSAFFSGYEIAFISSNRLKVELDRSKDTLVAKAISTFYKDESKFLASLLLGNNISLVLFGIFSAKLMSESFGIDNLFLQTIISTLLVLVTAEFLPKALVQINANGFLLYASLPMFLIFVLLYLPTLLVVSISNAVLTLLKTDRDTSAKVFSKVDLEHYVLDISTRIKDEQDFGNEMQILQNALDFSTLKARDCMVPRTEIVAISIDNEVSVLHKEFVDTGLSKILVFRENIDNVIGFVRSFDMFKKPTTIKQILMPINFVPAAMPGKELLEMFTKRSGNVAVVTDEYGGTAGVVTIEDVIEEIFGDIEDEHDTEGFVEEKLNDNEYRFSARIEIDYINQTYGLGLKESEEYDTLGGLIIHHIESIPETGNIIATEKFEYLIEEVSDRRIEMVKIRLL